MVRSRPNGEVDPLRMGVLLTAGAVEWRTHRLYLTIWPFHAAGLKKNVNGPSSEELGPVAEDRGFEPLRDVTPARVPGV